MQAFIEELAKASSTSLLIGIVGLIISGLGVYFTLRYRSPGQVAFIEESCTDLFNSIVKNLPELEVLYKKEPVSPDLVLLKGLFLNTGTKDITPPMTWEEPLKLVLPEDFKWLTGKIVYSPSQTASLTIVNDLEMVCDLGLLKRYEYLRFEAIVSVPFEKSKDQQENIFEKIKDKFVTIWKGNMVEPSEVLEDALEFTHRIADTERVLWRRDLNKYSEHLLFPLLGVPIIFFLYIAIIGITSNPVHIARNIPYVLRLNDSRVIDVKVTPMTDGTVIVEGVNETYKEILPFKTFFKEYDWEQKIKPPEVSFELKLMSIFLTIILFVGLSFEIPKTWKNIVLTKIVRRALRG